MFHFRSVTFVKTIELHVLFRRSQLGVNNALAKLVTNIRAFYGIISSSTFSQQPSIRLCSWRSKSSVQFCLLYLKTTVLILSLYLLLGPSSGFLPQLFKKTSYTFLCSFMSRPSSSMLLHAGNILS